MNTEGVIRRAVEACGSRTELAAHLDVSTSSIDKWRTLETIPAKHCAALHRLTGIAMHEMNPEVFDPELCLSEPWEIRIMGKLRRLRRHRGSFRLLKDIENMLDLEG